jgi:hypothetical protein
MKLDGSQAFALAGRFRFGSTIGDAAHIPE